MIANNRVVSYLFQTRCRKNRMRGQMQPPKGKDGFPNAPISASDVLIPITCWSGMVCESRITGIEFEDFWYESVKDGVCYFFRWLGKPRSTVLVIYDEKSPDHIECRTLGDRLVPRIEAEPIIAEVVTRFQDAGFWTNQPVIDDKVYPCEVDWSDDEDGEAAGEIRTDFGLYEDPDYSEKYDRFSDPVAQIMRGRKIACLAGVKGELINLLFPLPK